MGLGVPIPDLGSLPGPSRPGYPSGSKNLELVLRTTTANEGVQLMMSRTGQNNSTWADSVDFEIDWGDGTVDTYKGGTSPAVNTNYNDLLHTYATAGDHNVSISGKFPGLMMGDANRGMTQAQRDKLIEIKNWGQTEITGVSYMLAYCTNVTITAKDVPTFRSTLLDNSLRRIFYGCNSLVEIDLSQWPSDWCNGISYGYEAFADIRNLELFKLPSGMTLGGNNWHYLFYRTGGLGSGLTIEWKNVTWTGSSVDLRQASLGAAPTAPGMIAKNIDLSGWHFTGSVSTINYFISNNAASANCENFDISNWTTSGTGLSTLNSFALSARIPEVNMSNWDLAMTSSCGDWRSFFRNAYTKKIKGLDRLRFDGCTNFSQGSYNSPFEYTRNLTFGPYGSEYNFNSSALPTSNTNALRFATAFYNSGYDAMVNGTPEEQAAMYPPDFRNWNMSNVTDFNSAFNGMQSIECIDTSNWDLSSVTTMTNAFYAYSNQRPNKSTVDFSISLNNISSTLQYMNGMLRGSSVKNLTLDGDLSGVIRMDGLFYVINAPTYQGTFTIPTNADFSSVNNIRDWPTTSVDTDDFSFFLERLSATNNLNSIVLQSNASKYNADAIFPDVRNRTMTDYSVANQITDTTQNFVTLGVQVGDVAAVNLNNAIKYAKVTNVTANTLTIDQSIVSSSYRGYNINRSAAAEALYDLVATQSWSITTGGPLYPV